MDYAERGAVEKTMDELLRGGGEGLEQFAEFDEGRLVTDSATLSPMGRLYVAGLLSGILMTIRTFVDEDSSFSAEDASEIMWIVDRREREMVEQFRSRVEQGQQTESD